MRKILSVLLLLSILSGLLVPVCADSNTWSNAEDWISVTYDNKGITNSRVDKFEAVLSDIGVKQKFKGYNALDDGATITVANNSKSDKYHLWVEIYYYYEASNNSNTWNLSGTTEGKKFNPYILCRKDNGSLYFKNTGLNAYASREDKGGDVIVLEKGESITFNLTGFKPSDGKLIRVSPVAIYTPFGANSNMSTETYASKHLFKYDPDTVKGIRDKSLGKLKFEDVKSTDWFFDPILWAVENDITSGTSDTTFSPNLVCSHAQILTFLWKAAGKPVSKDHVVGKTSKEDYWYRPACLAIDSGAIEASKSRNFDPNKGCSRLDAVWYIWCAAGKPETGYSLNDAKKFKDIDFNDIKAKAVAWAAANGITAGTSDTTFSPDNTCTRAQIMTFLYKAFSK